MTAHALCPHCGYDLVKDEPIVDGEFTIDPRTGVSFRGITIQMSQQQRMFVATVAKACGRTISKTAIAERNGFDGDSNVVDNVACKVRKAIRQHGAPSPIHTVWGEGFRWQL